MGFDKILAPRLQSILHLIQHRYKTIWIMEDDIRIVDNPHKLPELITALGQIAPDWDIFFTDNEIKGADG